MPGSTEMMIIDFPVLFPLCEARIVWESHVSFCTSYKKGRSRLCSFHLAMKRSRNGKWDGIEVVLY